MSRRNHRQGFATVVALVALTLVSVTIGVLMTHISMEARRTVEEARRAQEQQIHYAESMSRPGATIKMPS